MPGDEPYDIEYLQVVVEKDIPRLPKAARLCIKRAIEERLVSNPIGFGQPLRYSLQGYRCLRIGDYRVVYCIKVAKHTVRVAAIKHRKNIYSNHS